MLEASPQSPVLVRKLRRKRHWQSSAATPGEQVAELVRDVFLHDQRPYSMYQVASDAELDRVALALNAGRDSLTEECYFVHFTSEEVAQAGIPTAPTLGDTPCHLANHLHVDCNADEVQIRSLIGLAWAAQRPVSRRSKGTMKGVVELATKEQCLAAVPQSAACQAPGCPPAATDGSSADGL